jgi:hypothetical protein
LEIFSNTASISCCRIYILFSRDIDIQRTAEVEAPPRS